MTTASDIITDAYTMLGVYGTGSAIASADMQLGLSCLNDMLDSWSNESLTTFATLEQSAVLVPGQQSYTIGTGGQFNMTRPIRILEGPGTAYVQDFNGNNYDMEVVPRDKWNLYSNRSALITSDFPTILFYDNQFPLGIINIAPFPTIAYTMFWDSYLQLVDFANINTAISLPPGYTLALKTNLAVALQPYFDSAQLSQVIITRALESKGNIKRSNIRPTEALYDNEIVSRANVSYSPYTDSVGSSVGSR
jgi:hypothetical protein